MANQTPRARPMSPHLQIYRWHVPMLTSILTRITGNAMIVSAALIVWWLMGAATGPANFASANALITSWFGDLVMTLSLLGLWYHLLAGLRHLIYDSGHGLDLPTAEKLGLAMLIGAPLLTLVTILLI